MDEDLRPKEFARNYPTAGCVICAGILGILALGLLVLAGFALVYWFAQSGIQIG